MRFLISVALGAVFTATLTISSVSGGEWSVPLAGNTFRSHPSPDGIQFTADGALRLSDANEVYSVYFHVDRPGKIQVAVRGRTVDGISRLLARVGTKTLTTRLQDEPAVEYPLGEVTVSDPGYVRMDLQCGQSDPAAVIEASEMFITSDIDGMSLDYVKNNEGNMFYWGRRGPSVHLSYQLPEDKKLTYAYSELTVPIGQDVLGSYFMANGFGEGYFGIQVNSTTERRVLFSVWSPFRTNNPAEIPADDRVVTIAKGSGVKAQDFGNEGSGGQSFLVSQWKAGVTYRFLTEVKPDGQGNTLYTSWFGDKAANEWKLIASFRRPKTDSHLTGFHSFLENFTPEYGNVQRSAHYSNQWVCDIDGGWHEITAAKFTGDNTARGRHRLDYAGGITDNFFFLRNCGFFDDQVSLDQVFQRDSTKVEKPVTNFDELPRN
jgi:hypothetical protein